jgi:hypothetical protein
MDANIYETGFPMPPVAKGLDEGVRPVQRLISSPWRDRIRIDRKARKYWEAAPDGQQSLGPWMASVLRGLGSAGELGLALERLEETGMVDAAVRKELQEKLAEILSKGPVAEWYAEGQRHRLEMKFLLGDGEALAVDRVVFKDAADVLVVIVDASREKVDYKAIRSCVAFLREANAGTGGRDVEAWVLKVPDGQVEKV